MARYLISFGAHAMDHIPDEDLPVVAKAAHAAVQEAVNAGVFVCAGGLVPAGVIVELMGCCAAMNIRTAA
jgi:hypothetical protein